MWLTVWEAIVSVLIKGLGGMLLGLKAHHAQLQAAKNAAAAATTAEQVNQQTTAEVEQSHEQTDAALNRIARDDDPVQRLRDSAAEARDATTRANDQL